MQTNPNTTQNTKSQSIMQNLLNLIQEAHQRDYSETVKMEILANNTIESEDESSMQTIAISFKVSKDLLYPEPNQFSEEALNKEIQASEKSFEIAKEYLISQLKSQYNWITPQVTQTMGLCQIQGIASNMLYLANILVTDHTLYITLTYTGQW